MDFTLPQLLQAMLSYQASDMHITAGSPPVFRVHGRIVRVTSPPLTSEETKNLCYSVLTDQQKASLEEKRQLDFAFGLQNIARFRGNLFFQKGHISGAFRHIPVEIPNIKMLGLPESIEKIIYRPRGLVLVTGATGSGKTTTLASILDSINQKDHLHIITIEDPIEYIHSHKRSIVNQREVGQDTRSFSDALKASLREDPDVILLGEMRDRETIETALTLAETGHLVFSTLHTNSTYQTINRIVQVFPSDYQEQVRMQLSLVLEGILTQALIERADQTGRTLAAEIMIPNAAIRNLIRENKIHQIQSTMLMGQEQTGMLTLNQSLIRLLNHHTIDLPTAFAYSPDPEDLSKQLNSNRMAMSA